MRILVISDLHFYGKENILNKLIIANEIGYDFILSLGDNAIEDLSIIKQHTNTNILGVLGNHDDFNTLKQISITNIHGLAVNLNDITIVGFEGSVDYKDGLYPSFNQEECVDEIMSFPKADILISHTGPMSVYRDLPSSHQGFTGIDMYLKCHKPKLHLHGHLHKNEINYLNDNTISICCFEFVIIELDFNLNFVNRYIV